MADSIALRFRSAPKTSSGDGVSSENSRGNGRTLADELRAIIDALAEREVPDAALADATRLAREIRSKLDGPRRVRWYDNDANAASRGAASRRAYLEQSPVRGELNPVAPPLVVSTEQREDGSWVARGRTRLGPAYEGPPGGVHGGWVAALFDDLLGAAQGFAKRTGVTGKLEVKYRQVTPIDRDLDLAAWITEERGRRIMVRGTCRAGETLTAEARAMFVAIDFDEIRRRVEAR
jgi:acyl-coenzyme A thioesterase PaaI-like protein